VTRRETLAALILLAALFLWLPTRASAGNPHVIIQTEKGDIVVEIDRVRAPVTAANFLRYVDAGLYDGSTFHRTVTLTNQPNDRVRIEVIQGGELPAGKEFPPIVHETTARTGLRHVDGAISMARDKPGTAASSFFICVNDQPELDYGGRRNPDGQGFAAFGRVVRGMEVVRAIQASPAQGQRLAPPIKIISVRRADAAPIANPNRQGDTA
jgi:peptidyl-prolyl cis-trans isomerase A (cyclophilin A)